MKNNTYVVQDKFIENNISEIDFDLYDDFGFKYDDYDSEFINLTPDKYGNEGNLYKLDKFISILEKLKSSGCNYVQIEDHCDHIGYNILGSNIRLATNFEIEEYENKLKTKDTKEQEIAMLQNKIQELRKGL